MRHTGQFLGQGVGVWGVAYLRHNQSCAEGKLQKENLAVEKALAASFQHSAHKRQAEVRTTEVKRKASLTRIYT